MGRAWVAVVLAIAACSFQHGASAVGDGPDYSGGDGPGSAGPDVADPYCYGTAPFRVCVASVPAGMRQLAGGTIQTGSTTDTACEDGGNVKVAVGSVIACAVVGGDLTIPSGSILRGEGGLPLVLLASGTLRIDGTVEVGSDTQGHVGPAADPASCTSLQGPGSSNAGCGGGGAGGSFGTQGGDGGEGNFVAATAGRALAPAAMPVDVLRGGCPGAPGGAGSGTGGAERAGGGAVYLVAGGAMTIDGMVDASGAGGAGAKPAKAGGGGGGSGGMIVIAAASLDASGASILANGGGGGGGADGSHLGNNGDDPTDVTSPAGGGGGGGGAGGGGGDGAAGSTQAMKGTDAGSGGGGGGGGGGLGVLRVLGGLSVSGAATSPDPS